MSDVTHKVVAVGSRDASKAQVSSNIVEKSAPSDFEDRNSLTNTHPLTKILRLTEAMKK